MQDTTVIGLAMRVDRDFPVASFDMGCHFAQTRDTLRAVEERYDITATTQSSIAR